MDDLFHFFKFFEHCLLLGKNSAALSPSPQQPLPEAEHGRPPDVFPSQCMGTMI